FEIIGPVTRHVRACHCCPLVQHLLSLTLSIYHNRSYWIPGSYAPTWSEKRTSLCKTIEKEGLQGDKGNNNEIGRPRHIHDPGIQQEPGSKTGTTAQADAQGPPTQKGGGHPVEAAGTFCVTEGRPTAATHRDKE